MNADIVRPAVSYSRWSSADQGDGDSRRRQRAQFLAFCKRHELSPLPDHEHPVDDGVSAYRGRNVKSGSLGQFFLKVQSDPSLKGVVLVVEAQDRISRQPSWDTVLDMFRFIQAGISVGICDTNQIYGPETFTDEFSLMRILMDAAQAHRFSDRLSMRLKSARAKEREDARNGRKITRNCPFWLKLSEDRQRWELIPERVEHVRLIFDLALEGKGAHAIRDALAARGIPGPGGGPRWHPLAINRVIRGRSVLGEFQPRERITRGTTRPMGGAVVNYYPPIVGPKIFDKANRLVTDRSVERKGRPAQKVNVFKGILFDTDSGEPYHIKTCVPHKHRMLRCSYGAGGPSISYEKTLEAFILAVKEIDPRSLEEPDPEVRSLADELANIDAKLAEVRERIKTQKGSVGFLLDVQGDLARDREATQALLREAEAKKRNPVKAAVKGLQAASLDDPEDFRARLRLAVEKITMRVTDQTPLAPRWSLRKFAQVEVTLRKGIVRTFWFSYRNAKGYLKEPVQMEGGLIWDPKTDQYDRDDGKYDLDNILPPLPVPESKRRVSGEESRRTRKTPAPDSRARAKASTKTKGKGRA
jgi:hypothetical protein